MFRRMTRVVGLVRQGRVYMGVDSAAVQGWTRRASQVSKVFRRGPFLIGYTTSFRMGQFLEHHLAPQRRIRRALEIAAHFNMGVCGPFTIKTL